MAPSAARRALVLGLLAGCLAVLPFLRDDLGASSTFLPICLAAVAVCDLLTAALLATQFLGRGSSQLLGLAAAYLAAGLLAAIHVARPARRADRTTGSLGDRRPPGAGLAVGDRPRRAAARARRRALGRAG